MKKIRLLMPTVAALGSVALATPIIASCNKSTTYTLSFDTNGGSAVASQTVKSGELAIEPKDPTKTGYTFDGWYTSKEYTTAFDFSTTKITANTTLYAKWYNTSKHIDALTTEQTVNITDQNATSVIYKFSTSDTKVSSDTLSALIKVQDGQTTGFSIDAKAYVGVANNVITLQVTYSALNVEKINDECKFDVYFTNADPDNTWAECFKDLSIKYASPFLNSSLESEGYIFEQTASGNRKLKIELADNVSYTNVTGSITTTSSKLTLSNFESSISNKIVNMSFAYDSSNLGEGETADCELTLNLNNYTQKFNIQFTGADKLYPLNKTDSMSKATSYSSFVMQIGLPLGANESESDLAVEITDITNNTITPVLASYQLNSDKDQLTCWVKIQDSKIVKDGTANFDIKVTKTAHSGTGYTAGWEKTITGLTLNYTGAALTLKETSFDFSSTELKPDEKITVCLPFSVSGDIAGSTLKCSDFTTDSTSAPESISWSTLYIAGDTWWNSPTAGSTAYYSVWTLDHAPSGMSSGTYYHNISTTVTWGTGTDYTAQDFTFKITVKYQY